jgi:hypothetical protein
MRPSNSCFHCSSRHQPKLIDHNPDIHLLNSSCAMSATAESERRVAESKAAVTASLSSVGGAIDSEITSRASDIHTNAAAIEKQEKELAKQTAALAKQRGQWQNLADSSTKKLNELGDIQNWAEVIERDLLVLEETMRLVDGKLDAGNISGTNQPMANPFTAKVSDAMSGLPASREGSG